MNTVADLVAQASASVTSLSPHEFAVAAEASATVVIDIREADERVTSGSIAGAVHVARGLLEFRADPTHPTHDPRLHPDVPVLVYCDTGDRSALAGALLLALGHTRVACLDGGLRAWEAAQLPVVCRMQSPY